MPKYRSVEQALAFAIVTAGGFAAFESMTYALYALDDESARAVWRVLLERTFITPFGHLPWTCIAVVVAATAWQAAHRSLWTPRALWGLAAAIVLHTSWNFVLVEGGWWSLVVPIVAAATFLLFRRVIAGVYYDGPHRPRRRALPPRSAGNGRRSSADLTVDPLGRPDAVALVPPPRRGDRDRPVGGGEGEGPGRARRARSSRASPRRG